jgi:hypothetical protein
VFDLVTEAEFVDANVPATSGAEPNPSTNSTGLLNYHRYLSSLDFDWLQAVYNTDDISIQVSQEVGYAMPPDTRPQFTPGTPVTNGQKVDILWISSSDFVSAVQLHRNLHEEGEFVGFQHLHAFSLSLEVNEPCRNQHSGRSVKLYVYSIQTFHEFHHSPSSEVPLQFLHHLLSPLPVGFFSEICFRMTLRDFPPGHCHHVLSIIPQDAPPLKPDNIHSENPLILTEFSVIFAYNREQLLAITSHAYSPHVRLCWGAFGDDQISPDEVNSALRDSCSHLRHCSIPAGLSFFEEVDEPWFSSNESFRSLKVGFRQAHSPSYEQKLLNGLKTNGKIRQLEIMFFIAEDEERVEQSMPVEILSTLILVREVLPTHASLRELLMRVIVQDSTGDDRGHFATVPECLKVFGVGCLSFLNVDLFMAKNGTLDRQHLSTTEWWDEFISPALLLNWYLDHQPNCARLKSSLPAQEEGEPGSGVVELVIQSVNRDILYPKTTYHAPYDSRTANAGVIYDMLRKNLCR